MRIVGGLLVAAALVAAPGQASASTGLNAYRVEATPKNLKALAAAGFDIGEGVVARRGTIDVVGTAAQVAASKLDAERLTANRMRRAAADPTAAADDSAWTVWTKYDAVAGDDKEQYAEQYERLVAEHPGLVAKRVTGTTYGGREIVALQVTKGATGADIAGRPAVLYNAMQHAREWLAGETCRRTLEFFVANYGKTTSAGLEVTRLVDSTELWFVCVNNPDGYEFTFTPGNRLWRKNLRDNNNDGVIAVGDGVDPNRNFRSNWGRDNDGSSPNPESETYRGPAPASEPETTAMEALFAEIKPVFHKNDHTAASLLLYPQGFQQDTPSADHEIFTALAGDPFEPAIEGFLPELAAGLYITNGDFTDWAYNAADALSFTPEGTPAEDPNVSGFEYADSELQIQQEFERHKKFALDLARSAGAPEEPDSHLDNTAEDFVVDTFAESYGDPQPVGAVVKRKLGDVTMRFKVNNGPTQAVPTAEYEGGERYFKEKGLYYHRVRGFVSGTKPGDEVKVWFSAGGKDSPSFTYRAVAESAKPVLILANEDWSGVQPEPPGTGPKYLDSYKAALDAAGVPYEVYDVDAHGRRAPHALGVLAHFSHVVWYTGDDYVPREPDAAGGTGITKRAVETQNAVRDFLNDGGKLFYTGKNAGRVFAEGYEYNPFQDEMGEYCPASNQYCVVAQDDFLQYYLGAYRYVGGGGEDDNGDPFAVEGTTGPFDPLAFGFNGPDSAQNNDHTATLLVTSSVLDPATFPLFADSKAAAAWDRPFASPFDPHAGDWFLSAGTDDAAYKRLLKGFDLTGQSAATLKFWTSYDLEPDYDYMFVEIHSKDGDDWTTLADANGHTSDDVGLSCPSTGDGSNWQSIHPFLANYQTKTGDGADCTPTGTTGAWNAATGNSGGWQEWSVPVPAQFLGKEVEIAIAVVSDPAVQGLGTWVDELRLEGAGGTPIGSGDPSFESGMDGWTLPGPPGPAGDGQSSVTGWERAQSAPFVETPVVTTNDTVYTGFGFEAITGAANRAAFMGAVFSHLGAPEKPAFDAPKPKVEGDGGPSEQPNPPGPPFDPPGPPPATPPAAGASRAPAPLLGPLSLARRQNLATVLTRGVLVGASCTASCRLRAELVVSRAVQRRHGLRRRTVGSRTASFSGAGVKTMRVRLSASARRGLRRASQFGLEVRVTALSGPRVRRAGTLTVRRARSITPANPSR